MLHKLVNIQYMDDAMMGFIFRPIPGEMIQYDLRIFFK